MNESGGRVAWIAMAPVKALALHHLDHTELQLTGIAGDRAFAVVDGDGRLMNGKRLGELATIRPDFEAVTGRLSLRFSEGLEVCGYVQVGEVTTAAFFGKPRPVRPVIGPWGDALSTWAHRKLQLVAAVGAGEAIDRGPSVSLLSTAALTALAQAGKARRPLDSRRFRMTFGIDDVSAFAEDAWIGRDVRVGGALIRPYGNVGRCAVTTQDPDTGVATFDTLRILQQIRGSFNSTEALPCGVVARIVEPGRVQLGDQIHPV